MTAKRPTFAECYEWHDLGPEDSNWNDADRAVFREIAAILRTLAAGYDARTVRVTEDGRVVWWREQP